MHSWLHVCDGTLSPNPRNFPSGFHKSATASTFPPIPTVAAKRPDKRVDGPLASALTH